MNLQPSQSTLYNDRRELFAWELVLGGHGQVPLSGAGTFYPSTTAHVFYKIDFLSSAIVSHASFKTTNAIGDTNYAVNSAQYINFAFPSNYSWAAPLNSITLSSGTGIGYEYLLYNPELQCGGPVF